MSDARQRVVLVSGLSGAGKASILRALEDIGFEAIDNPPLTFIEEMVARADPSAGPASVAPRIAVGVDARSRGFRAEQVLSTLARLRANPGLRVELLFATADEQALLRRFTETRRRHPLAPAGLVTSGIAAERALIGMLQEAADLVIDTTDLPLAGLRQLIEARFAGDGASSGPPLAVSLISFGFPGGLPREADLVFDARFLRNPHYDPALKPLTGLDSAVGDYVEADSDFAEFFGRIEGLLGLLLPRFVQEGKKYATVAIGCTGGRHRSVHIIEKLAATLIRTGWRVTITHRELAREGFAERSRNQPSSRTEAAPVPAVGGLS